MQRRSVLLLPSNDCGWNDLRAALRAIPRVDVKQLDEAMICEDMFSLVADVQPDVIITATYKNGESLLPLLREVQQSVSPTSRIALVTPRFTPNELMGTEDSGIVAHLQWSDLHPHTLPHLLEALIFDGVHIVSREVAKAFVSTRCCSSRQSPTRVSLAPHERAVLRLLAEGWTEKEIAQAHGVSRRTVERQVSKLETKLGARTQFELAVKAAQFGVLS